MVRILTQKERAVKAIEPLFNNDEISSDLLWKALKPIILEGSHLANLVNDLKAERAIANIINEQNSDSAITAEGLVNHLMEMLKETSRPKFLSREQYYLGR